jgi:hypothetical protein
MSPAFNNMKRIFKFAFCTRKRIGDRINVVKFNGNIIKNTKRIKMPMNILKHTPFLTLHVFLNKVIYRAKQNEVKYPVKKTFGIMFTEKGGIKKKRGERILILIYNPGR